MKLRLIIALELMVLAGLISGAILTPSIAAAAADTEDVVYLSDGRVLHGRVISQSSSELVFEWVDKRGTSVSKIKLTLDMEKVLRVERDVAMTPAKPAASANPAAPGATVAATDALASGDSAASTAHVAKIYKVVMSGQMGTDVYSDPYREIVEDIKQIKPDVIVIEMDCKDSEDRLYSTITKEERGLAGKFDDFRTLVNLFHDDLAGFRQVVWIKDSVGMSTTVALSWPELYMKSSARLGGLVAARDQTGFDKWQDEDVRGKMTAAFMSWMKSFLEYGGYPLVLADAMVRPEFDLSASFKGRAVKWDLSTDGDFVVDRDKDHTANFSARMAENVLLSDGTVDELADLAFLLGFEEYEVVGAKGEEVVKKYKEDWRRSFKKSEEDLLDFEQFMKYAGGDDAAKWLGKAKGALVDILASMNRYGAVELRMRTDHGVAKLDVQVRIEQINEQLRQLKNRRGGAGGGRGTGGGSPGGG